MLSRITIDRCYYACFVVSSHYSYSEKILLKTLKKQSKIFLKNEQLYNSKDITNQGNIKVINIRREKGDCFGLLLEKDIREE